MSLPPPDRRHKEASQSTGSFMSHPMSSSGGDSISESIASLTSDNHSHTEMALLRREVQKLSVLESHMMRMMNTIEAMSTKIDSFEHRIRSLETMQVDASKTSQTFYVDGFTPTRPSMASLPPSAYREAISSQFYHDSEDSFQLDDTWSESDGDNEDDGTNGQDDNPEEVRYMSRFTAATSLPRANLQSSPETKRELGARSGTNNSDWGHSSVRSLSSRPSAQKDPEPYMMTPTVVDPKVELAELYQLFPSRYDLFAAIFVGIFDQIQQLAEQTEHSTIMFNNSAGDIYQRIQRMCSCLRYEGTKEEVKLPLRNAPAMTTVMRQFRRESKTEIVTVTASSLLSLSSTRSLRPVYRALVTLWRRMQDYPELFPAPYNDILRLCSKDIIKSVRFDLKLDPSMNPQYPAIYDINLSKLRVRNPTLTETMAMKINFADINTYILRRHEGQKFEQAIEGIVKESKEEKKVKAKAEEVAAMAKKRAPVKPMTMKDLAKLRKEALKQ